MPKISVITGAYNAASCPNFDKSIKSVLDQTFGDFEFIICDDGSTDATYMRLKEYAAADTRILLLQNAENLGLVKTLNKCLEYARGEYVARHDCDDYNSLDRFEKQVAYLDANSEVSILGTSVRLFDENGVYGKELVPKEVTAKSFLFNNPYKHGSVMLRRSAILNAGGYRVAKETVRNEDYDLFMRMHTFCRGANIEEPLYYFCEDKNARNRRKYKYRINEAKVRAKGFSALGLMPKAVPYVVKPLIVGLLPDGLLKRLQARRRKKRADKNTDK